MVELTGKSETQIAYGNDKRAYVLCERLQSALRSMADDAKYANEADANDLERNAPAAIQATEEFATWLNTITSASVWINFAGEIVMAICSRSAAKHDELRARIESYL